MWTADSSANSLSAYAVGASGTDAPIATVHGAATGLSAPSAVAISPAGNVFVANAGNDSITEYASGADGNAAPLATIAGSKTGLDGPSSLTIAGGALWVTDPASNLVESFTAGSDGNILPAETLAGHKTKLDNPVALAVDNEEFLGSITVVNNPANGKPSLVSFYTDKRGDVRPQGQLVSAGKHKLVSPTAIMQVGFASFWIADSGTNTVSEVLAFPGLPAIRTRRTISGASTGLDDPTSLGHDALGRLVVANAGDHTVRVFGAKASGNVAPTRVLSGVGTGSGDPAAAAIYGVAPGEPTDLKVRLHGTSAALSWKPPAVTGGGIVGYQVMAFRTEAGEGGGGFSVLTSVIELLGGDSVPVSTRKTTFTKHNIKPGHLYVFIVSTVNAFGTSHASHPVKKAHVLPPSSPRKVGVLAGPHALLAHWKQPKLDGGARLRYVVQYAAGCAPGTKGCKAHRRVVSSRFADSTRITSLKRHTTYDIRVIAKNKKGASRPSKVVKATTQ
jgi:hypothetical protein